MAAEKKTAGFEETRLKKWQGGHFLRTFQGSALTALHCCRLRPFDKLRDRGRQQPAIDCRFRSRKALGHRRLLLRFHRILQLHSGQEIFPAGSGRIH